MKLLRVAAVAAAMFFCGTAIAKDGAVTFHVSFSGRIDCNRPSTVEDVPVHVKGVAQLRKDGTTVGNLLMTAYHVLKWRTEVAGRLGAKPMKMAYGSLQLRVLDRDGLQLIVGMPNNEFFVNIRVDGDKCVAELLNKMRPGQTEYNIYAGNKFYYCDGFRVTKSSCKAA